MPEKPIMHGRDHRPGGTDPIPGLGGNDQGVMQADLHTGTSQTITAGSQADILWDDLVYDTSGVFSGSASTASGWHVNDTGLYMVSIQILLSSTWPTAADGPIVFELYDPTDFFPFGGWNSYTPDNSNIGYFGGIVSTYSGSSSPALFHAKIGNQSSVDITIIGGGPANNATCLTMCRLAGEVDLP